MTERPDHNRTTTRQTRRRASHSHLGRSRWARPQSRARRHSDPSRLACCCAHEVNGHPRTPESVAFYSEMASTAFCKQLRMMQKWRLLLFVHIPWRLWRLIARSRMTGRAWGVFGRHHTPRPRPLDSGGTQQTSAANGGKILCSDDLGWSRIDHTSTLYR